MCESRHLVWHYRRDWKLGIQVSGKGKASFYCLLREKFSFSFLRSKQGNSSWAGKANSGLRPWFKYPPSARGLELVLHLTPEQFNPMGIPYAPSGHKPTEGKAEWLGCCWQAGRPASAHAQPRGHQGRDISLQHAHGVLSCVPTPPKQPCACPYPCPAGEMDLHGRRSGRAEGYAWHLRTGKCANSITTSKMAMTTAAKIQG